MSYKKGAPSLPPPSGQNAHIETNNFLFECTVAVPVGIGYQGIMSSQCHIYKAYKVYYRVLHFMLGLFQGVPLADIECINRREAATPPPPPPPPHAH